MTRTKPPHSETSADQVVPVKQRGALARLAGKLSRRALHTLALVPVLGQAINARLLSARWEFDESHRVETHDGAHVALHRYLPQGPRRGNPVILCHGIACNRFFWDISPERSFAKALAAVGRDVWVIEMRGHGQSHRVDPLKPWQALSVRWDFDHYVQGDLPAAIAYVRKTAGTKKVDWIGHSMGGMVMYAYLGTTPGEDVGNVVTLGSPTFLDNRFWAWRLATAISLPMQMVPHWPIRVGAWAASGVVLALHPILPLPIYASKNMSARDAARLFHNVLDDISGGEVALGLQFIRNKGFLSRDGKVSYADAMREIRHPFLVAAGAKDYLVMPRDVRAAFERLGTKDKQLVVFSKKNGHSHDYGHADLVLGRNVRTEVLPVVMKWLEERTDG